MCVQYSSCTRACAPGRPSHTASHAWSYGVVAVVVVIAAAVTDDRFPSSRVAATARTAHGTAAAWPWYILSCRPRLLVRYRRVSDAPRPLTGRGSLLRGAPPRRGHHSRRRRAPFPPPPCRSTPRSRSTGDDNDECGAAFRSSGRRLRPLR